MTDVKASSRHDERIRLEARLGELEHWHRGCIDCQSGAYCSKKAAADNYRKRLAELEAALEKMK